MTTEDKTNSPAGMSEVSAKFEHKADAALTALGQDWPPLQDDAYKAQAEEDDVMTALPKWVREVRSKIGGHELTLSSKGSSEQAKVAARQAIADLDTPEYRAARVGFDAAKQRTNDRDDALFAVWERILATPAHTAAGALVKLRIGVREIINNYGGNDGCMPEESEIGIYDRMTLAALADLERLAGADTGPCETTLKQALTTTGRSGMSQGGAPWIELEGMICDGVREANCLRAICETGHFDEFEEGLQYLANNLTVSLREISRMYYELHGLVHGSGD